MSENITQRQQVLDRKAIILQEAAHLFREKGYLATTLRELASRSGVQGGSIYHHFSSKQEILFQIMNKTMINLISKLNHVVSKENDIVEQLRKAIQFHIEYHVADSDETTVSDAELRSLDKNNYDKITEKRHQYEGIFLQILNNGQAEKVLFINDPALTCKAIIQLCTSVSFWYRKNGSMSMTEIVDKYIDIICWGVLGKENK